jgi:hypothetical protein
VRLKQLGQHPAVFRSMTGLPLEAFDEIGAVLDAWPLPALRRIIQPTANPYFPELVAFGVVGIAAFVGTVLGAIRGAVSSRERARVSTQSSS